MNQPTSSLKISNNLWMSIAKNEYKLKTVSFRKYRKILPIIVISFLIFYLFFLAPWFFDIVTQKMVDDYDIDNIFFSYLAVAFLYVYLLISFWIFFTIPIMSTLQDIKISGQMELLLSTPISPGDLLFGEFLGKIPLYFVLTTLLSGIFTSLMFPLGIDSMQVILIIFVMFIVMLIATWIGNITAAILRTKLMKSARGKDIGRGLALIIALPSVGIMYGITGGFLDSLINPNNRDIVKSILDLLPSSWGANVILDIAKNPGNISNIWISSLINIGGLILCLVLVLFLGLKLADRAYNLEPSSFNAKKVKKESIFYKTIRISCRNSKSSLLFISLFKNYIRTVENFTKVIYSICLMLVANVFIFKPESVGVIHIQLLFMCSFIPMFNIAEITLQGKEKLLIYKQTPISTFKFLLYHLIKFLLITIPIVFVFTIIAFIRLEINSNILLLQLLSYSLLTATALTIISFSYYLFNPAFNEKSGSFVINMLSTFFFAFGMLIFYTIMLNGKGYVLITVMCAITYGVVAMIVLPIGIWRINRLE